MDESAEVEHIGEPELTDEEQQQVPPTPAELVVMGLATLLDAFEKELDEDEATKALVTTPTGEILDVDGFGSALPDFVYFDGRDDEGRKTRTILPSSVAALTLKAIHVPASHGTETRERVGFRIRTALPENTPPDV
ncbi:hypothetical protein [Armatimonas sp.]|uniref:hypothetical protein n=1 Tax=Armatimonas sp. TaxID=1872638 RepID=UPI00286CBCC7|nr:hypothetical protein [Armatimonas sp.]